MVVEAIVMVTVHVVPDQDEDVVCNSQRYHSDSEYIEPCYSELSIPLHAYHISQHVSHNQTEQYGIHY